MTDIPQEVRNVSDRRDVLAGRKDNHSIVQTLHTNFLAGKQAAEIAEHTFDDVYIDEVRAANAMFLAGKRAGMERAAEIAVGTNAETRHVSLGDKCAQAIRSETHG